jgi:ParB-like chromosome segregation protein Spo0J
MDRVEAMVEFEEQGGHLPPIVVVGDDNLLGDGHHRLAAARRSQKVEIDAERIPGGKPEAVAAAIIFNDIATKLPLTREQRNRGIKQLLQAGWTQKKIALTTGVEESTISGISKVLGMRGFNIEPTGKKSHPKAVAALPSAVHERLNDTTLVRIASVPIDQQIEFATAVAETGLAEPRVREAIKKLGTNGMTPTEAVYEVAPRGQPMPTPMFEVAKRARRHLDAFLDETMLIDGTERAFWDVLEVIARNPERFDEPSLRGLSTRLAEIAVKADAYASRLSVDEKVLA